MKACFCHSEEAVVRMPDMGSLGVHLSHEMLGHLVDYHLWGRLPGKHQTLAILMRVADFLGDVAILQNVAQQLGVPVESLQNTQSYQSVKKIFRDYLRRMEYGFQKFHRGKCIACYKTVDERTCEQVVEEAALPVDLRRHIHTHLCCCDALIHRRCLETLEKPSCPLCKAEWALLPCCLCFRPISADTLNVPEVYKMFKEGLKNKTSCCKADLHPECRKRLSGCCPICKVKLDDNGLPKNSELDAMEYVFISRSLYLNEECRKAQSSPFHSQPNWPTPNDESLPRVEAPFTFRLPHENTTGTFRR